MSQTELNSVMDRIGEKYNVEPMPLKIGERVLKVLQVKDLEEYLAELIEQKNVAPKDLPYWAKVWDSSLLLAYFLGKQPVVLGRRILEIGAGIGVIGVYAGLCGHSVTITDIDEDALLFAKANALLNGVSHVEVKRLDWKNPDLAEPYDMIVGSEVVYDRESYPALVRFLCKALAPNGMIFLAKNASLHTPAFFEKLAKYFEFKHTSKKVTADGETQEIMLYAIRPKQKQ